MRKITSKFIKKRSNLFYCIIYGCYFHCSYDKKKIIKILYFYILTYLSSKTSVICHTQLDALTENMFESSAQSFPGLYIIIIRGFTCLVLMAVCDANYCFSLIDIGQYGSNNDSGVLAASKMGQLFEDNEMNLPSSSKISESDDFDFLYFL